LRKLVIRLGSENSDWESQLTSYVKAGAVAIASVVTALVFYRMYLMVFVNMECGNWCGTFWQFFNPLFIWLLLICANLIALGVYKIKNYVLVVSFALPTTYFVVNIADSVGNIMLQYTAMAFWGLFVYGAYAYLFSVLKRPGLIFRILIAIALLIPSWLALPSLGNRLQQNTYEVEKVNELKGVGVGLYLPAYLPPGTAFQFARVVQPDKYNDVTYLEVDYNLNFDGGSREFTIYESKVKPLYNPPVLCGHLRPETTPTGSCDEIANSGSNKIYYLAPLSNGYYGGLIIKDDTLLTMEVAATDKGEVQDLIGKDEIDKVLSSLRSASLGEISRLEK